MQNSKFQLSVNRNNTYYTFPSPIQCVNIDNIIVKNMILNNSFYTVRKGFNSKIVINGATINIKEGTYSHFGLKTQLEDDINAVLGGFLVSFETYQDTYTISSNNNFSIDFTLSDPSTYRLLGFENQLYAGFNMYTSTQSPRLSDSYVKIRLSVDNQDVIFADDIILPIISQFRSNIVYYNEIGIEAFLLNSLDVQFTKMHILILDENNNEINLRNSIFYCLFEKIQN